MNGQQNRVVRNIIALLVNQIGTWSVTLVTTLVVLPYLGNERWGLYAFVQAYSAFFAVGMTLGTGTYLTWRIARDPQSAGRLTFNTLLMQIPLTVIFLALGLILLPVLDSRSLTHNLSELSLLATAFTAFSATCTAALAGFQIMRPPALINLVSAACGTSLLVGCVALHLDLLTFLGVGVAIALITLLVFLVYTQRAIHLEPKVDLRLWRTITLGSMPFFTWSVVLLFYGQVDITMLHQMVGDAEVGWYAAANRVVSIPVFLPTIVITAILPALSREHNPDSSRFHELASRSLRLVMAAGIPAAAGTVMVAGALVPLLRFPASFNQMSPLIIILALNMPVIGLDMVLGTILIALGRQRAWTGVGVISAVFNPVANLWAIPYTQHAFGNGAIGASCVTLATELVMLFGALCLKPRSIFTWGDIFYIVRCLLAAAIMIPSVWALSAQFSVYSRMGVLLAVGYGIVIYAIAAYALQVVTNEDIKRLIVAALAKANISVDVSQLSLSEIFELFGGYLALRGRKVGGRLAVVSGPLTTATSQMVARVGSISQPLAATARGAASRISGPLSRPVRALANGAANLTPAMASANDGASSGVFDRGGGLLALAVREEEEQEPVNGSSASPHRVGHEAPHGTAHTEHAPSVEQEDTLKSRVAPEARRSNRPRSARGGKHSHGDIAVTDRLDPSERGSRPTRSKPARNTAYDNHDNERRTDHQRDATPG